MSRILPESEGTSDIVLNRMGRALVATIQVNLTPSVIDRLQNQLLEKIRVDFAPFLILELSGLDMIDLDEFEQLKKMTTMAEIMGVKSIYSGLQPAVVMTLIQLNANVNELKTVLNLDEAFDLIRAD